LGVWVIGCLALYPAAAGVYHQVALFLVGEAFSLDRRGWKAAPTGEMPTDLKVYRDRWLSFARWMPVTPFSFRHLSPFQEF
jgi:hypothetical protein